MFHSVVSLFLSDKLYTILSLIISDVHSFTRSSKGLARFSSLLQKHANLNLTLEPKQREKERTDSVVICKYTMHTIITNVFWDEK